MGTIPAVLLDFRFGRSRSVAPYSEPRCHCPFVHGDRTYASFIHQTGYASNYYTYVLDKVIALDFFSQFDKSNLLGGEAAMRYRTAVLEPGGSKPGTELVSGFLHRQQNLEAFKKWMDEEFQDPAK